VVIPDLAVRQPCWCCCSSARSSAPLPHRLVIADLSKVIMTLWAHPCPRLSLGSQVLLLCAVTPWGYFKHCGWVIKGLLTGVVASCSAPGVEPWLSNAAYLEGSTHQHTAGFDLLDDLFQGGGPLASRCCCRWRGVHLVSQPLGPYPMEAGCGSPDLSGQNRNHCGPACGGNQGQSFRINQRFNACRRRDRGVIQANP